MAQKFRISLDLAQLNFIAQVLTTTEASPVMADSCLRSIRNTILKADDVQDPELSINVKFVAYLIEHPPSINVSS